MLLRRAGFTASAGLSCFYTFQTAVTLILNLHKDFNYPGGLHVAAAVWPCIYLFVRCRNVPQGWTCTLKGYYISWNTCPSTKYLRFFFILSGTYLLLNDASYDGEILHADECRPCAGHVSFYVYRGRCYENNDIFLKLHACRPTLLLRCAQAMGRSVGP